MAFRDLEGLVGRKIEGVVMSEDDDLEATELTVVFEDDAFLTVWWTGCYPAAVQAPGERELAGRLFLCMGEFGINAPPDPDEGRVADVYGQPLARVTLQSRDRRRGAAVPLDLIGGAVGRRIRGIVMHFIHRSTTRVVIVLEDDRFLEFVSTSGEVDWLFEEHGGHDAASLSTGAAATIFSYFDEPCTTATIQ